jgi:hypothetical protein
MARAEVRLLHQFMLLVCIFKGKIVFGKLFCFERFLQGGAADWAECESLLFNFDKANFAEGVSAVKIAGNKSFSIEVLVTRRAFH